MNPILSELCLEPEGSVIRHVYPMILTPENLKTFWEKARKFRTIFTEDVNSDFKKFMETFVSQDVDGKLRAHGLFWVIDNFVGVYYLTNISRVDAKVHYSFFDRRHLGREKLTRAMLLYGFKEFNFWRLTVEIPQYASQHTFGFVKRVGFRKEGKRRKAAEFKGERCDVECFGLLREEAEKWVEVRDIEKPVAAQQQA